MQDILDMYIGLKNQTGFTHHYMTLFSLVAGIQPKRSFEFGTGISTQVIVRAHRYGCSGIHISNDVRDLTDTGLSNEFIEQNLGHRWKFIQGDSMVVDIPKEPYGFVLHDGSHVPSNVYQDLKKIIPMMQKGGVLAVHDTLEPNDGLKRTVEKAVKNIDAEILTLPYGYGLTLVRILEDFGNGEISPSWKKKKAWESDESIRRIYNI